MASRALLIAAGLLLAPWMALHAGEAGASDPSTASTPVDNTPAPSNWTTSYEFDGDTSYVGAAKTDYGAGISGNVSENRTDARLVLGAQDNGGPIYRFGLAYQRYSFGFSQAAPMPNLLEAENAVVGVDFTLFDSWVVRVEADPGFYSDGRDVGFRDFNVPFTIGGSYIAGEDLQWVAGLEVDIHRQIPVFPAVGFRWAFHDQWVLDAILPTPRLEYEWSKALTLYIGGDVDDDTYRVEPGFGSGYDSTYSVTTRSTVNESQLVGYRVHPPGAPGPIYEEVPVTVYHRMPNTEAEHLSGSYLEYDEVRVGAGFTWKASKSLTFELEAGYLPYREFDFHRADVHFSNNDGAAYGQMSLNAQF